MSQPPMPAAPLAARYCRDQSSWRICRQFWPENLGVDSRCKKKINVYSRSIVPPKCYCALIPENSFVRVWLEERANKPGKRSSGRQETASACHSSSRWRLAILEIPPDQEACLRQSALADHDLLFQYPPRF